jgi:acyl-coenzyme A thioesterase PaaI-like protein
MANLESVNALMTQTVPFNRVLDVRVTAVEPERAEVALPASPERLNHVGTVHAAAQFGLGEAASGAMVVSAFGDLQAEGYVPLAAKAAITYRHAAMGDLRGVATLAHAEQERIRQDVRETERARFVVPVQLLDGAGAVTTEMEVEWALVRRRGE